MSSVVRMLRAQRSDRVTQMSSILPWFGPGGGWGVGSTHGRPGVCSYASDPALSDASMLLVVPGYLDGVTFFGASGNAYSKRTGFGSKLLTLLRPVARHPCFS
jgi:hypothetical protein